MALGDYAYRGTLKQASAFAVVPVTPSDTAAGGTGSRVGFA